MKIHYLQSSNLAEQYGVSVQEFFLALEKIKYLKWKNGEWQLTELGKEYGKKTQNKKGNYFVWKINPVSHFPLTELLEKKYLTQQKKTPKSTGIRKTPKRTKGIISVPIGWPKDLFSL